MLSVRNNNEKFCMEVCSSHVHFCLRISTKYLKGGFCLYVSFWIGYSDRIHRLAGLTRCIAIISPDATHNASSAMAAMNSLANVRQWTQWQAVDRMPLFHVFLLRFFVDEIHHVKKKNCIKCFIFDLTSLLVMIRYSMSGQVTRFWKCKMVTYLTCTWYNNTWDLKRLSN